MFTWFAMLWIVIASSFLMCFPKTLVRILYWIAIKTCQSSYTMVDQSFGLEYLSIKYDEVALGSE